ncbi:MAG: hypothetical protein Q8R15_03410 [Candidatus Micrarchaeota archaeon]|nr:hypothetical protein [Candidatus Micrarchaeota archaeon]
MVKNNFQVSPLRVAKIIVGRGFQVAETGDFRSVAILAQALKRLANRNKKAFGSGTLDRVDPFNPHWLLAAGRIGAISKLYHPAMSEPQVRIALHHGVNLFTKTGFKMPLLGLVSLSGGTYQNFCRFDEFISTTKFKHSATHKLKEDYLRCRKKL